MSAADSVQMGIAANTATADRWVGVGRSMSADARTAGTQAATEALAGGAPASLLMVFCSSLYDRTELMAGLCAGTPDQVRVVGCTSLGEIAPGGPGLDNLGNGPAVVAIALGGPGFQVATSLVRAASTQRHEFGAESAAIIATITAPHQVFLMIADGLTLEHHELVRGAYGVLGATVPIVGGCSADNLRYESTASFYGTGAGIEVVSDAIVGIALGSSAPIGLGIAHGWSKTGDPMVVTSSENGEVFLLDGEPALDVFLRRIGADRSLLDDPATFRKIAFQHPIGLSRRSGEDLRVVHDANVENGSLICLADVPQGALAWTMTTQPAELIDAAARSCQLAYNRLNGAPATGFVVFDCGARLAKLGPDQVHAEQRAIASSTMGAPFGGFYTYGEIGRVTGSRGMHQLTVVTLALA